ncbi:hypothetical protein B0J12DRAFT_696726 [Macrophomina phaseolina]|uniref:Uncharacterized protein n=1 Tax=Macrophomina phaseolina TaxID=35725 RepID=A0ABQ8GKW7_9PEZI|nr:hypothetical protein B0J12DRAFT_696726 [Macrophomina phaseolina]
MVRREIGLRGWAHPICLPLPLPICLPIPSASGDGAASSNPSTSQLPQPRHHCPAHANARPAAALRDLGRLDESNAAGAPECRAAALNHPAAGPAREVGGRRRSLTWKLARTAQDVNPRTAPVFSGTQSPPPLLAIGHSRLRATGR